MGGGARADAGASDAATADGLLAWRWADPAWVRLVLFVAVALVLRVASFGELGRHADESFYFLVGQRMHDGLLPYVDVWDRKPLGLFLAYYLLAGISRSVLSYQIAACILAAATAFLACAWVRPLAGARAGVLAGIGYLVAIGPFEGATGQTPDFYNPLIAGAALLLYREWQRLARGEIGLPVWAAMALCGLALTFKQTTIFEAAFLGLYVLFCLARAGVPPARLAATAALCCAIGALPSLAIAAFYAAVGHWPEFWHAMVQSNVAKLREGGGAWRMVGIVVKVAPLLVLAAVGLAAAPVERRARIFLAAWIGAGVIGFAAVPNFYGHYLLPLLAPLSIAAGLAFARITRWLVPASVCALYSLVWFNPFDHAWAVESNRGMRAMTALIRRHDHGGGLLVFDGPVYLYATAQERFLSPLVFPQHLNHRIEMDVSHLRTLPELARILAGRPGVIVMSRLPRSFPVSWPARRAVLGYARANCRIVGIENVHADPFRDEYVIFGDCDRGISQEGFAT